MLRLVSTLVLVSSRDLTLQVYLERQGSKPDKKDRGRAPDSSNWEAVARLLSRKHDRIDSQHALELLPGEVMGTSLNCEWSYAFMCESSLSASHNRPANKTGSIFRCL
jgi:hypothetical protein